MACVGCGTELQPGFAFCPRCGRRQPAPCAACGFVCDPDFAFCPGCGAARAAAAAPAAPPPVAEPPPRSQVDRRPVTVLFADLTGFTALSERLDAEEVRAFQTALFAELTEAVARLDGYVAKFLGDSVLAVFGAPVAHEDDPVRALQCARDMLARGEALSARWAFRLGQPVALHIAVHTGPVVAGSLGEAAGAAYDITGDTVNTAARILGAAVPGAVLVSDVTVALARHRFAFAAPEALTLRGKAEPISVRRLLGPLAEPQSARGLAAHGLSAPMIGRSEELDQLLAAFDRMARGRAQVVSVVGEAGTGKSRLIGEFLARLGAAGRLEHVALRRAACSSLGEAPYGVFAALFREGYHVDPDDSLDDARRKLASGLAALGAPEAAGEAVAPVLSYLLGVGETGHGDLEPEQLKRQLSLAARTLVERRLEQQPVLMVVDDYHWADAASAELLRDIADRLHDRPLMLLASHRPDVAPLAVGRASHGIIRLAPLADGEIRELLAGLFGQMEEGAFARVAALAERAGGNPLFVEEIVRSLVETGELVRHDGGWACTRACEAVSIPPTLQGLLLSGVDRLPDGARRLLQEAAVIGIDFGEGLLSAIVADKGSLAAGLDRLVTADLVEESGRGRDGRRFRFRHALMREAVYENLLIARRTALHERIARALEATAGPAPARLSELEALGHHWSLTADRAKGARYLMLTGDRARAVYANDDAVRHYQRALATLAAEPDAAHLTLELRERLADLLALGGGRAEALAHYAAVRDALGEAGDRAGVARLHRKLGGLHWQAGDTARAQACFAAGLDLLDPDDSALERAQLYQETGRLAFRVGDSAAAIAWAERALAETDRADAVPAVNGHDHAREAVATRVQAYNTLGVALARTGRLAEAVSRIEQSIALAAEHDLLQAACRGYTNLGVLYSSLDPRRSIATCLKGLEVAKRVGDLGFQSRLYANLAVAYCALTDRCEVEGMEAAQKAIDLDRRLELLDHLAVPLIVLGQIHQCHGDHDRAFAAYEEALRLAEQIDEPQLLFPCYDGLATLNLDAGNLDAAEAWLAKAQALCARAGLDPDALMVLPFLC